MDKIDELTFNAMFNVLQSGMWLLNDLETYLRPLNMSQARLSILLAIIESDDAMVSPKKIARLTGKSRPAISRTIDKLAEEGFLFVQLDTNDGRGKKLCLSDRGKGLLEQIIPEYNLRISEMSSQFSEDEKILLNTLLKKINFLDKEKTLR